MHAELDAYLEHLRRERQLSPHSLAGYRRDMQIIAVEPAGSPVISQYRAGEPLKPVVRPAMTPKERRMAMAPTGPIPGRTPMRVPRSVPKKQKSKLSG